MPRVDVLMATYNGEAFLAAQIDSVLAQQGVDVCLVVRDDASCDGTPDLLRSYVNRFPGKVVLLEDGGGKLGASGNFFRLLVRPTTAAYVAFCDQDDVWPHDKLQVAIAALDSLGSGPRLYGAAVEYVDEHLHPLASSSRKIRPSFNNALAENITQGCTMVMDAGLQHLIAERPPEHATIHDWWTYLVASAFGRVFYDPVPRLQYRQHGANVIGGGFSFRQKWSKRYQRFMAGNAWKMADQAEELLRLYPDILSAEQKDLINYFVAGRRSVAARIRFLFGRRVWRQSFFETLVVKLLVLINAY